MSIFMAYAMVMTVTVCAVYGPVARYALLIIMATGVWITLPVGVSFATTTFRDMDPKPELSPFPLQGLVPIWAPFTVLICFR